MSLGLISVFPVDLFTEVQSSDRPISSISCLRLIVTLDDPAGHGGLRSDSPFPEQRNVSQDSHA